MPERGDEQFDRRELLRRGTGAALALGVSSTVWPAAARGVRDRRLSGLARELDGDLVVRGSPRYGKARLVWNARFDGIHPLAVAYAETTADLQRIIRWAKRYGVHVAARSSGHSFAGYSTTTGLVADLSRMAEVQLATDGTATVDAGASLGSVYDTLWTSRRAVPLGTCLTVAAAGLTLGGGHGFSSRALGLACDNLLGVEIVTADGRLLVCNGENHADLYWALRGAGAGSFGFVRRLHFRTHPVGDVTTVNLRWDWAEARKVVQAWQGFAPEAPDALSCVLSLRPSPSAPGTPQIALNGQVFANRAHALSLLEPLTDAVAPTKVSAVQRPFSAAVQYFAGGEPAHRAFAAKSNYVLSPIADEGITVLLHAVEAAAQDPHLASSDVVLSAHGGAINRVGRDATAFVHRNAVCFIRYTAFWDPTAGVAAQAANLQWVRSVHAAAQPYVSREAVVNYVDPELRDWRTAYYGTHLRRLVRVKRRYDRDNFFRFPQSIPTRL